MTGGWLLYVDELRNALRKQGDLHGPVAARRASFVESDKVGVLTPASPDPVFVAVVDKVLGPPSGLPAERSTDPYVLSGVAASPGIVPGTARVVCTREEASKLRRGDIMCVAHSTLWCRVPGRTDPTAVSETANNANGLSTSNASADGVWETLCVNASSEPLPTFFFTCYSPHSWWAGAPDHSDSWPVGIGNDAIRLGHGPLTASGQPVDEVTGSDDDDDASF